MTKINLGDKFYSVDDKGLVTVGMVGEISLKRNVSKTSLLFSNPYETDHDITYKIYGKHGPNHFTEPTEAIAEATKILRKILQRGLDSKKLEEDLRLRLERYENSQGAVVSELLEVKTVIKKSIPLVVSRNNITRYDMSTVPTEYFYPGTRVWGIVTPRTHFMTTPRIFPDTLYFILDTVIESASLTQQGTKVSYRTFGSRSVKPRDNLLCLDLETAQKRMQEIFREQTPGEIRDVSKIPILTKEDVAEAERKRTDAIIKSSTALLEKERRLGLEPDHS